MIPLIEAAAEICETARREKLALAVAAERSGDAIAWFARNIPSIVGTWRKNDAGDFEAAQGDGNEQSLYIRRADIDTYLRWARTVK